MRFVPSIGVAVAAIIVAIPALAHGNNRASTVSACAVASASIAQQLAVATPTVPAQVAWDCILSVPIHKEAALELLDEIEPYLEWQTTTAYLKNPPAEYVEKIQPPVDLWAGLRCIKENIQAGVYTKEYDVSPSLIRQHRKQDRYLPHAGINGLISCEPGMGACYWTWK